MRNIDLLLLSLCIATVLSDDKPVLNSLRDLAINNGGFKSCSAVPSLAASQTFSLSNCATFTVKTDSSKRVVYLFAYFAVVSSAFICANLDGNKMEVLPTSITSLTKLTELNFGALFCFLEFRRISTFAGFSSHKE